MFKSRTVFVVGAGASNELDMPVGSTLRDKIVDKVGRFPNIPNDSTKHGDYELLQQVARFYGSTLEVYERAGLAIQQGIYGKPSIDEFLEWNRHDEAISNYGRAAIAKCILESEYETFENHFSKDRNGHYLKNLSTKWFGKLFSMLMSGLTHNDGPSRILNNVDFIIFNYDRCLEYYLYRALQSQGITAEAAAELVSNGEKFIHIYGSVAPITGPSAIPFGHKPTTLDFGPLGSRIRVYTDNEIDGPSRVAQSTIAEAETLVFLGFFFNERNLDIIRPSTRTNVKRIFGTAYERSEPDIDAIRTDLAALLWKKPDHTNPAGQNVIKKKVQLADQKCSKFFDTYSATLPRPVR